MSQRRPAAKSARPQAKQGEPKEAVQAGARKHPARVPPQHQAKPGQEAALRPRPQFLAPDYRGSGKLEGKTALITGGDSGIGRAVAVLFAREGADVAIVYLDEHGDAAETKRCVEAEGRQCMLIAGDVRDATFCRDAVQQTAEAFGALDILVNNAAYQQHAESLETLSEGRFDETLKTNVYLLERGIRVNAIAPGPVWTPLNPADKPADLVAEFGRHTDMHRPAQPEELSPAYVFLASPVCSGYITGIVLPVTGSVGAI